MSKKTDGALPYPMIRTRATPARYFKPYYILNLLLIFAYPATRLLFSWGSKVYDNQGYRREDSILFVLVAISIVKYRRSCTFEHFVAEFFWLAKLSEMTMYFFIDFQAFMWYILACTILYLFFRAPKYDGPSNMIHIKNEDQFDDLIIEDKPYKPRKDNGEDDNAEDNDQQRNSSKFKPGKKNQNANFPKPKGETNVWFVEFYANWAESCVYTKAIWSDYSLKYTTTRLRFAEVDVANLKDLATRYTINTSVMSRQLPTLILFEDGEEKLRFPPISQESGKVGKVLKYDKVEIAKYFDLDKRYLGTRTL